VHLLAIVKHLYQDARCNGKDCLQCIYSSNEPSGVIVPFDMSTGLSPT